MTKVKLGSIITKFEAGGYTSDIDINEEEASPLDFNIGYVKIFIKGDYKDLVNQIESAVKRTVNKYQKQK
jgi:hypothetical protein